MEKLHKSEKNNDNFSEMEDVPTKKVLDFFGRMVHNGEYEVGRIRMPVAKHTLRMADNLPGNGRKLPFFHPVA